jgi:hypothetical protein
MLTLAVVVLILALILGGVGFSLHVLWWFAVIALIVAVVLFLTGRSRV